MQSNKKGIINKALFLILVILLNMVIKKTRILYVLFNRLVVSHRIHFSQSFHICVHRDVLSVVILHATFVLQSRSEKSIQMGQMTSNGHQIATLLVVSQMRII